jgi:outer membrane beta-barrel protein
MNSREIHIILIVAVLSLFARTATAAGLELNPDELKGESTKKSVAILQNRYFLKSWRPEVGLLVGSVTNEAFTKTKTRGARVGVFLNEWVGLEAQYILTTVRNSADRVALNQKTYRDRTDPNKIVTADAEVNPIKSFQDFVLIGAPLYGKVNVLDLAIVYVDIYGTLGMSRVGTEQGTKNAYVLGGGQRFYFAQRWSGRLDFRNRSYTETREGKSAQHNSWTVDGGVSIMFR